MTTSKLGQCLTLDIWLQVHCLRVCRGFGSFCDLLHPCKTARHAPQRMVSDGDSIWLAPGSPWPSSPGRAVASLATMGVVEAVWGVSGLPRAQKPQPVPVQLRWQRSQRSGQDPEEAQKVAQHRVKRLESAMAALGETVSAEARALDAALKEARRAAQGRPIAVQITECLAFIQRSQNRLRQMEEERVAEQKALDEARARLSRLHEEMARIPEPSPRMWQVLHPHRPP